MARNATTCSKMVLHHVADGASLFVKLAASLDAELFRHRDLHAVNVIAVPDGLEKAVGKAEDQQVLDRLLAEIVVDAKDVVLGKHLMQGVVQLACRHQVAAEGFFQNHARIPGAPRVGKALDDNRKHAGWYRQVVGGRLCPTEFGAQRGVGLRIVVVAVNVVEQLAQLGKGLGIHASAKLGDAVAGAFLQLVERPP